MNNKSFVNLVRQGVGLNKILELYKEGVTPELDEDKFYILESTKIKYLQRGQYVIQDYIDLKAEHPKGYTYVYLLTESNYVGITKNINDRINKHKRNGKTKGKVRLLGMYQDRIKAHLKETEFHSKVYNGYSGN